MIYSVLCLSLSISYVTAHPQDSYLVPKLDRGANQKPAQAITPEEASYETDLLNGYHFLQQDIHGDVDDDTSLTLLKSGTPTNSREVTWRQIFDGDDMEYAEAVKETENPVVSMAFLATKYNFEATYDRDEALLPEDLDDAGDAAYEGDSLFILMTSFSPNLNFTGTVIAVDDSFENSAVLIEGLGAPTGLCFDSSHDLLYVTDLYTSTGYIYQYEISRTSDAFELRSDQYIIVYEGSEPYDCAVDVYGNLYFVDRAEESISVINYLDLWSGFKNQHQTIYSKESGSPISSPTSVDVYESDLLYYTNGADAQDVGLVNRAFRQLSAGSGRGIETYTLDNCTAAYGVVVDGTDAFFSADDGFVYKAKFGSNDTERAAQRAFEAPRGLCVSEADLYVADSASGVVYRVDGEAKAVFTLENVYGLHCVNGAVLLALSWLSLVVF
jgi:sugar lactone lactonase YvrE